MTHLTVAKNITSAQIAWELEQYCSQISKLLVPQAGRNGFAGGLGSLHSFDGQDCF